MGPSGAGLSSQILTGLRQQCCRFKSYVGQGEFKANLGCMRLSKKLTAMRHREQRSQGLVKAMAPERKGPGLNSVA